VADHPASCACRFRAENRIPLFLKMLYPRP
jgi:hypothetical protein